LAGATGRDEQIKNPAEAGSLIEGATMPPQRLREWIKNWWEGEYIPPHNPPGADIFRVAGHFKRHWTARAISTLVAFCLREWKWLFWFAAAVAGLALAYARLQDPLS
jgi:hypothetical protein